MIIYNARHVIVIALNVHHQLQIVLNALVENILTLLKAINARYVILNAKRVLLIQLVNPVLAGII